MIFILLILIIAVIVIGLNIHDSNNLEKIRNYLHDKECSQLYYGYGSYKGLCKEDVTVVENSFSLDIAKNKNVIKYDTIVHLEHKKHKVVLNLKNNKIEILEFKQEKQALEYYEKIQEKI